MTLKFALCPMAYFMQCDTFVDLLADFVLAALRESILASP